MSALPLHGGFSERNQAIESNAFWPALGLLIVSFAILPSAPMDSGWRR
jgi:hypothetical protein